MSTVRKPAAKSRAKPNLTSPRGGVTRTSCPSGTTKARKSTQPTAPLSARSSSSTTSTAATMKSTSSASHNPPLSGALRTSPGRGGGVEAKKAPSTPLADGLGDKSQPAALLSLEKKQQQQQQQQPSPATPTNPTDITLTLRSPVLPCTSSNLLSSTSPLPSPTSPASATVPLYRRPFEPRPRPVWRPDNSTLTCELCNASFRFFFRRHHCRQCGGVMCSSCTSTRLALPEMGYTTQVRVCTMCTRTLTSTAGRRSASTPVAGVACVNRTSITPPPSDPCSDTRRSADLTYSYPAIQLGDRVIASGVAGYVRFVGRVGSRPARHIGVELDYPLGDGDGSIDGIRYFTCRWGYGKFDRLGSPNVVLLPACPPSVCGVCDTETMKGAVQCQLCLNNCCSGCRSTSPNHPFLTCNRCEKALRECGSRPLTAKSLQDRHDTLRRRALARKDFMRSITHMKKEARDKALERFVDLQRREDITAALEHGDFRGVVGAHPATPSDEVRKMFAHKLLLWHPDAIGAAERDAARDMFNLFSDARKRCLASPAG